MSKFKQEVGGYRGRRTVTDILRIIAILLAIAVVLLGAGLFFGQRYIIYTDEGMKLDIPFFRQEEKPSHNPGDMSIVELPGDSSQQEDAPVAEPEPEKIDYMNAVQLSLTSVLDGTAEQRLKEAGGDALILEMKAQSGKLSWVSGEKMAKTAKANPSDESVNEVIRQWNAGDVYTIARVSCFRDDSLPYYCNRVALRSPEGNWRDEAGMRHLDPTDKEAQEYIAGLCGELAELGFDEILLEYCTYPVRGRLDRIQPVDGDINSPFGGPEYLLALVNEAVAGYETAISVHTELGILTGEVEGSGIKPEALWAYTDRLWLDGTDFGFDPMKLQEAAGYQDPANWIVAVGTEIWQKTDCHQAFLSNE